MTVADVAKALAGRRSGAQWMARCPAHDDRQPSLSLTERDGRLLVHCHAGCSQAEVIAALKDRGLWPERPKLADKWLEWRPGIRYPSAWGRVAQEYVYQDADGRALYSVFRLEPKSFRQGYRDASGKWVWRKHPHQVPYRLPQVLRTEIIFVAEGEKDAETLADWGFCATCNAGGAGKWRAEWGPLFAGKTIIILPDADEPGYAHARQIAAALLPHAARVVILPVPGAKDISQYFERGGSEVWLCEAVDRLLRDVEEAQYAA